MKTISEISSQNYFCAKNRLLWAAIKRGLFLLYFSILLSWELSDFQKKINTMFKRKKMSSREMFVYYNQTSGASIKASAKALCMLTQRVGPSGKW